MGWGREEPHGWGTRGPAGPAARGACRPGQSGRVHGGVVMFPLYTRGPPPLLTHSLDYIMFLWIRILEAFACGMVHVREGKEAVGRTESWPFVHQSSIIVGLHIGRITYWMDCGLDRLHIELTGRAAAALPPGAPRLQTQTPHPIIDGLHIGRIADWMDCRSSLPRVRPRTRTPCDFGPTVWGR